MKTVSFLGRSKAFNLANMLTYGRLAAVPVVVGLLFWPEDHWSRWLALIVFALAAITDYLDGYVARTFAQQSALGRMLDPIADKLLVAASLLMLVADGTIKGWALWAAIVILCREILAELKVSVPVSRVAKWKTTLQLVALGFLIAGPAGETVLPNNTLIGTVLLWIAAVLTIYTGWDYFKNGIQHLMDEG
jgi:CDP-diacylglycerol--glycerol-3-phosphate 3-phosphatidyltransferase/cardiolipin synthase